MTAKKILCLFDVDGTLTKSRQKIDPEFDKFIQTKIKPLCHLGLVSGSDFKKLAEQIDGEDIIFRFHYVFPENGLVQYKFGKKGKTQSIKKDLGEENIQKFINYVLGYLSKIVLPVKRGTFVEFRTGMINISPIGRSCSQEERDVFEKYDGKFNIRQIMIEDLRSKFPNLGLCYAIGGQISFDAFPKGWDKTYCLRHLENEGFNEIHFFGDRTYEGGNDYEICKDPRVIGHKVLNPEDTKQQLEQLFNL